MLEFLRDKATERKLRLFASACVRRGWARQPPDEGDREEVELAERYADGLISPDHPGGRYHNFDWLDLLGGRGRRGDDIAEARARCGLLRDLFGYPFRTVRVEPSWLAWNDGAVLRLARTIDDGRDFEAMPVLADALEEAGCDDPEVLRHCREGGPHGHGCWVLDALLGELVCAAPRTFLGTAESLFRRSPAPRLRLVREFRVQGPFWDYSDMDTDKLDFVDPTPADVRALADSPYLERLRLLDLRDYEKIDAEVSRDLFRALADRMRLPPTAVTWRQLSRMPDAGFLALGSRVQALAPTGEPCLYRDGIGAAAVQALAASADLASQRKLDLSHNQLTDAGAQALAASPALSGLLELDLSGNDIGDAGGAGAGGQPRAQRPG
jgi:hypothetical protein